MSSKKSKTTSTFAGLFGSGGGRRRKGNLEDLIHQFIIQDPNVLASKPETPLKDDSFKKKLKKSKLTIDETATPSKLSSRPVKNDDEIELENDNSLDPISSEPLDLSPSVSSPKRNNRAKKEKTKKEATKKETTRKTPEKKKETQSKSQPSPKAKGSKTKKGEKKKKTDETDEDQGLPPNFFFDDNKADGNEEESKLPYWLQDEHIKDNKGHGPDDEDYDPTTLEIPVIEYDKLPSVQKKYWDFKCRYFDKIVAFKMWTCYFFYANDALIMHKHCDTPLSYYKGRVYSYCHEKVLFKWAPKLLELGHKLVILKQPDDYNKEEMERHSRDIFQILTRGTYTDNSDMTYASQYCMCIYEQKDNVGLVYFDTTTHEFYLGEFKDDSSKNNLKTILMKTKPAEIVHLRNHLSQEMQLFIKSLPSKPSLSQVSIPAERTKSISTILEEISNHFAPKNQNMPMLPELISTIQSTVDLQLENQQKRLEGKSEEEKNNINEEGISHYFTIRALSLCLNFLKDLMLEDIIFSQGIFNPYDIALEKKATLYLDGQALQNLEIFDVEYMNFLREDRSLFGYMDKTVSHFGKRMFKKWLTSPLLDAKAINERLQAVEDLINNETVIDFYQSQIKELPDLERIISRIYNLASKKRMSGVRFEDFVKNKLLDFLNVLEQLEKVEKIIVRFEPFTKKFKSTRLINLVTFRDIEKPEVYANKKKTSKAKANNSSSSSLFPKVGPLLTELKEMVRVKDGLLVPALGLNEEVDNLLDKIEQLKDRLLVILEEQKSFFNCRWLKYVHTKQRYEIEIPEEILDKVQKPKEYVITSKKKGFIRLHTPKIEDTLAELRSCEYELNNALVAFIVKYFRMFYDKNVYWRQVVCCLAELDCLCGLAKFANTMQTCCRPEVLPMSDTPVFELKDMVHPCIAAVNRDFVPNDFIIDNNVDTFLITGPNMGGKSTFLRQVCIAVIMAQVGSFVPASSFRFSLVDRIFTRIGASDRIIERKSTFFIELEETYNIVMEASRNSLVIIDELGRGTSTYDGFAFAYASLKFICEKIRCITLFATHYHLLLDEFKFYKNGANYYMASELDNEKEEVIFKYKFVKGQADKSHGIVIAKMAGLPPGVLEVAREKAAFMTNERRNIGFQKSVVDKFNKVIEDFEKAQSSEFDNVDNILEDLSHL